MAIYPGILDYKREIAPAAATYPTDGLIDRWNFNGSLTGLNGNSWTSVTSGWTYSDSSIGVDATDSSGLILTTSVTSSATRLSAPNTLFNAFDDVSTAFTFSLWFRADASTPEGTLEILGKGTWGTSVTLCQIETANATAFTGIKYGEDHGFQTKTGLNISLYNWHHYVITLQRTDINTGRWHVFIDDVSVASSNVQASLPDTDNNVFTLYTCKIGVTCYSNNSCRVDQLYLYNRVLSNAEISQLYNEGIGV
jgi:hypothetical protein